MYAKQIWIVVFVFGMQAASAEPEGVDYQVHISPLFSEKCISCHGPVRQEAGLRLDHGSFIRTGGDEGAIVDFEDPDASVLLHRLIADDETRMPPPEESKPLSPSQIELVRTWIAGGAPSPADEPIPASPEEHWAWQVLTRTSIPGFRNGMHDSNPIDAFINAKAERHGLRLLPPADKATLLRRVTLDLTGLPPTREQQVSFFSDSSPDGWSRLVDRLLDRPSHGERWARHWMDVWRYSDWAGFKNQLRRSQRHIWRWRDWIVDSLNADKGYDQMIVEMLAADEVDPLNNDALRATGFLARNFHNSNRNIWLDATVEHTAKAFLSLTINCARCHDHKYDPISQREFYGFRAIFEPHHVRTDRIPGQPDLLLNGLSRAYDANPDEPTYLFVAGNEKQPLKDAPVVPAVPSVFGQPLEIEPVELPALATFPSLSEFIETEDLNAAREKLAQMRSQRSALERKPNGGSELEREIAVQKVVASEADLTSLKARWKADRSRYDSTATSKDPAVLAEAAVAAEHVANRENAKLEVMISRKAVADAEKQVAAKPADKTNQQGLSKARKNLEAVEKNLSELPDSPSADAEYTSVGEIYPQTSTGRRAALARWIIHRKNPLTARVAVNYVWLHHFGQPLVANVFDFGLRSPVPKHRELLDWLAVELIDSGWSFKHLHRLMVTSRAYRRASSTSNQQLYASNQDIDPDNQFYWRANVRRLEAEAIRDSVLFVAGNLDAEVGGPDISYAEGEVTRRRSVYVQHAYEKQMQMLVIFDAAAPTECYRRSPSVIPQQALALANSPLSFDQARSLAGRLSSELADQNEVSNEKVFVNLAFQTVLNRNCRTEELQTCIEFLATQSTLLRRSDLTQFKGSKQTEVRQASHDFRQRARENLIHALLNHNDFVTIR